MRAASQLGRAMGRLLSQMQLAVVTMTRSPAAYSRMKNLLRGKNHVDRILREGGPGAVWRGGLRGQGGSARPWARPEHAQHGTACGHVLVFARSAGLC